MDTVAQSYVAAASQQAGAAADAAENRKRSKYRALESQFIVQSIDFETMGTWGAEAKIFQTAVRSRVKQANGERASHGILAPAYKYKNPTWKCCSGNENCRRPFLFFHHFFLILIQSTSKRYDHYKYQFFMGFRMVHVSRASEIILRNTSLVRPAHLSSFELIIKMELNLPN